MTVIQKKLSKYLKNEHGSISIESILWLPFYALFLVIIVDVSVLFNGRTQAQRTLQDINRLASTGYYTTEAEVETRALELLGHLSDELTVDATIDSTLGVITAVASIPANDLTIIGTLPEFADFQITVGAWHMIES